MTDPTNPGEPPLPAGPPPSEPSGYPAGPPITPDPTTTYAVPPSAGAVPPPYVVTEVRTGGGGKKLLLGLVVLVVLVGGAYASLQLLGGDDRGAASPEAAGEQLIDALNQSDVLAVIDLLPEGERDALLEVADLAGHAERLGVLDDAFTLDGFEGVAFEITDPEFEAEEVSDSDAGTLTLVSLVGGEASVEVDGDELTGNVGAVIEAIADEAGDDLEAGDASEEIDIADVLDELEEEAEDNDSEFVNPFTIAVVEEDGRFFPSIGFTIAELARADANRFGDEIDAPDLDDGIEPQGGDTPEEAVQALFDAATSADAEEIIAVLDPGEWGALQVYAPLFTEFGAGEDTGIEIELTAARVEATDRGGSRVVPTGLEVSGELDDVTFDFILEDQCIEVSIEADDDDFELDRTCFDEDIESDIADDVDIPEEIRDLVAAFQPIEGGIVTVERDGQHFVSPIRTGVQSIEGVVDDLDRSDLEEGGIVFEALNGELEDEFDDLGESLDDAFADADPDEAVVAALALLQDLDIDIEESLVSAPGVFGGGSLVLGIALVSSFDDLEAELEEEIEILENEDIVVEDDFDDEEIVEDDPTVRVPTGATGPNGELLLGDVVEGSLVAGGTATFNAIGVGTDGVVIGAQALDGSDLTVTIIDPASGEEIDFNDDFGGGTDPEVLLFLEEGQLVTIEIGEFRGDAASFVVYYEAF